MTLDFIGTEFKELQFPSSAYFNVYDKCQIRNCKKVFTMPTGFVQLLSS
jgi:hypothetical protein